MKKIFLLITISLLFSVKVYAETVLLKCKYLDGNLERYKNNKVIKKEKPINPDKEYEIQLNPVSQKISKGPHISYGTEVSWLDDWVIWQSDSTVVGARDAWVIYSLNRVTGKLTKNFKLLERVVEDGKFQKDSNGKWVRNMKWQTTTEYQCKKEDRLF